ncbi:MAG: sigma-70 family RNA polymerase sigma factor [Myxococcota bacterium]
MRRRQEEGDHDGALTLSLRAYGPEVMGLLVAIHGDETSASDAFALFCERLWTSMPSFRWECSMRTWAYRIGRAASADVRRAQGRRGARHVPLSPSAADVADRIRTETLTFLRTESKTALQRLREELPADDRTLLVLRLDRQLSWRELATVFVDGTDHDVDREAARLRKRFQLVKDRLVKTAKARGIVKD